MIDVFDSTARFSPKKVFLKFTASDGTQISYTYRQMRLAAAALARKLLAQGAKPGDCIVVDMPNSPEFVATVLAAGYADLVLAAFDTSLAESEKIAQQLELERDGKRIVCQMDSHNARRMLPRMRKPSADESVLVSGIFAPRRERSIMGEQEDIVHDTVHFAERAAHLGAGGRTGAVFFESTANAQSAPRAAARTKAVQLSWSQLSAAANAANSLLESSAPRRAYQERLPLSSNSINLEAAPEWQCVLPLSSIEGFQTLARAVVSQTPIRLYETFEAEAVVHEARNHGGMRIALNEHQLDDMLTVEEWRSDIEGNAAPAAAPAETSRLSSYRCMLLTGGAPSPRTLERATEATDSLFVAYGMLETAGLVAAAHLTQDFRGGMRLAPGYSARIIDPDEQGYGTLALRGPGVFDGYLNAKAPFTVDHWYITDNTALMFDGRLYVRRNAAGAQAASSNGTAGSKEAASTASSSATAHNADSDPYGNRIKIQKVILRRVRLDFSQPIRTPQSALDGRDSLIVQVVDSAGRVGLGECTTLGAGWRNSESIEEDERLMRQVLAPALAGSMFTHPREASALFSRLPGAAEHPMAAAALETAVWDLFAQSAGCPLWQLLNDEYERLWTAMDLKDAYRQLPRFAITDGSQAMVGAGATVGLAPTQKAYSDCAAAVASGYRRVKLKVAPGIGLEAARAISQNFPDLLLTIDAGRSFSENNIEELIAYDDLGAGWIEEPFATVPATGDPLAQIAEMQQYFRTPLCVDESYTNASEAERILQMPSLRCIAVKVGKFGGIWPALAFVAACKATGRSVWMAGTYDSGVSRRVSAAFETLPDMVIPGDIGSVARYFRTDITMPPYAATRGMMLLNGPGHETGLGCDLDEATVQKVQTARSLVE